MTSLSKFKDSPMTAAFIRESALNALVDFSYTSESGAEYTSIDGFFLSLAEGNSQERIALLKFVQAVTLQEMKIKDNQEARSAGLMISMDL
jgi:hypothetical protein